MLIGLSMLQFFAAHSPYSWPRTKCPAATTAARSLCGLILALTLAAQCPPVFAAAPADADLVDIVHPERDGRPPVQTTDFYVTLGTNAEAQKYLTYGWSGWAGRTIRWRYNDSNRPTSSVASEAAAITRIQAAMAQWSAVCNVQFVYDGATTAGASLPTGSRDGQNVIAWGALSGNVTGITYVSASGTSAATLTIDESDLQLNYQFNPNLDATLVHELGHMLGLRHSNVEGAVMSGPNPTPDVSTLYTGLSTLQADDISGCLALYGAPPSTLPATRQMSEFHYVPLDYYFITSRNQEKAILDAAPGWVRTGATFPVLVTLPAGGRGITRFYFDKVARGGTRGSHFYTLLDAEVTALVNLNPAQRTTPGLPQNEGIDAYGYLPLVSGVGGSCPSGQRPVYRAFRGAIRFPDDPNHRFTTDPGVYSDLLALGWDGEGVVFCVPAQ